MPRRYLRGRLDSAAWKRDGDEAESLRRFTITRGDNIFAYNPGPDGFYIGIQDLWQLQMLLLSDGRPWCIDATYSTNSLKVRACACNVHAGVSAAQLARRAPNSAP